MKNFYPVFAIQLKKKMSQKVKIFFFTQKILFIRLKKREKVRLAKENTVIRALKRVDVLNLRTPQKNVLSLEMNSVTLVAL